MTDSCQKPESIEILGVRVDRLTRTELLERVSAAVHSGGRAQVMYANVHVLNTAYVDGELRRLLNRSDLVYCDGAGVRMAARLLGQHLPDRMTGADWIHDLCLLCQKQGLRLYFLGGEAGIAALAAEKLCERYPGLPVAGTHHGYFEHFGPENEQVIAQVNASQADILLVGFGTPVQERWIALNFQALQVPVVWAVGALVDFVAGKQRRAPNWMLAHDLEWLGRLAAEPRRMWRRYLVGNPLFFYRVIKQRAGLWHRASGIEKGANEAKGGQIRK